MTPEDRKAWKTRALKRAKSERPLADLRAKAKSAAPIQALTLQGAAAPAVIAEPDIRRIPPAFGPWARSCVEGGTFAFCVGTDRDLWGSTVEDFRLIRLENGLPMIRRDVVVDEYQIWECRVLLASATVLSFHCLGSNQLREYLHMARELSIQILVEASSPADCERALDVEAPAVLFEPTPREPDALGRLRRLIPRSCPLVVVEAARTMPEYALLRTLAIDGILLRESLSVMASPAEALRALKGETDGA